MGSVVENPRVNKNEKRERESEKETVRERARESCVYIRIERQGYLKCLISAGGCHNRDHQSSVYTNPVLSIFDYTDIKYVH